MDFTGPKNSLINSIRKNQVMIKSAAKNTAAAAVLALFATASFATGSSAANSSANCLDSGCSVEVSLNTDINVDTSETSGIYLQTNHGDITATTQLTNLIMRDSGAITVETQAIANNFAVDLTGSGAVPLDFVSQTNDGNVTSISYITQNWKSVTGEVTLNSTAVANNLSITTAGTDLSEFGAVQCNTGDVAAVTKFHYDPTSISASTTAVGNNLSINGVRQP